MWIDVIIAEWYTREDEVLLRVTLQSETATAIYLKLRI